MRFRPRKILIYLLIAVSAVVLLANFLSFSDPHPTKDDGGPSIREGPLAPERRPIFVPFEERFRKYVIDGNGPQLPVSSADPSFQAGISLALPGVARVVVKGSNATDPLPPPSRNWTDNEWYREQFVRRVWKGRPDDHRRTSIWVAKTDPRIPVSDDRILEQMDYVPRRYRGSRSADRGPPLPLKTIYVPGGVDAQTPLGMLMFVRERCPVSACNITTDPTHETTAHLRLLQSDAYFSSSDKKPPGQIWAIWILESPANTVDFYGPADLINWTATYRWDSTIVTPYAKFVPFRRRRRRLRDAPPPPLKSRRRNYAANKTKMVAWFVSNCNAKNSRWEYAQELGRYVPVDIFGACGTLECPRSEQSECNGQLNSDYKFYLSFENSNCDHYITEKFFENGLGNDIVPIVMGARREDYRKSAPPNSYIHVDDFSSVRALADHLLTLNASDHLYNEYFRWKGTGEFVNTKFWCRLCALLHDEEQEQRPDTWYTDFHKWWTHDGACHAEPWTTGDDGGDDDGSNNNNKYNSMRANKGAD